MAIVSLEYALNYCRIDIDPDDEAYKIEIQLVKDCIAAAEEYLKNATGKDYADATEESTEYTQERIFLCRLISNMYENRSPTVSGNTNEVYRAVMTQLQLK